MTAAAPPPELRLRRRLAAVLQRGGPVLPLPAEPELVGVVDVGDAAFRGESRADSERGEVVGVDDVELTGARVDPAAVAQEPNAWLRCWGSSAQRASCCGLDSVRPEAEAVPAGRKTLSAPALETVMPWGATKSGGTSLRMTCTA